jgi:subtilisin family serine protease
MTPNRIAIASLLAAALAAPAAALAAPSEYVEGQVLVKFRADAAPQARAGALAVRSHADVADLEDDWKQVRVRAGQSVEEAVAEYAADPSVEYAQPNFVYRIAAAPNDPHYGQLWGLSNTGQAVGSAFLQPPAALYGSGTSNPGTLGADVNVEPAWNVTTDCSGALVAVVDSGVNHQHEDLAANMWNGGATYPNHGWDYVDGDNDPMDANGHGTHVAGTIGAVGNNAAGIAGVCWKARIIAVRVMDAIGFGDTVKIIRGIDFAVARGAKVINMSIGGGGIFDLAYGNAIGRAQTAGVVVVVAAGNEGNDNDVSPTYPCSFSHPNVICVAALDQDFGLASFSNYGATSVDVGAPGTNIVSTWAGTHSVVDEPLTGGSGWTASSGRWVFDSTLGPTFLVNPPDYITNASATYSPSSDDRVWKTFDLFAGASVVTAEFEVAVDVNVGDWLRIGCRQGGGDPFSGGLQIDAVSGVHTFGDLLPAVLDLSPCAGPAAASLGARLTSDASWSPTDYGVAISPMTFKRLARNGTSYNTIAGTSMAAPAVAGLATLLRSYNPAFGYADVVTAIREGGDPIPSLAGITTSGKAINVARSLAHLKPPAGLRYVR